MESLVSEFIKFAFAVATVIFIPLLGAIVVKYLQKLGISIDAEKQAKLEKFAQDGILAAEEFARGKIASELTKLLPAEKMAYAVKHLLDQVPGIGSDEAEALVNQELPKIRAASVGFLTATREAVITP